MSSSQAYSEEFDDEATAREGASDDIIEEQIPSSEEMLKFSSVGGAKHVNRQRYDSGTVASDSTVSSTEVRAATAAGAEGRALAYQTPPSASYSSEVFEEEEETAANVDGDEDQPNLEPEEESDEEPYVRLINLIRLCLWLRCPILLLR